MKPVQVDNHIQIVSEVIDMGRSFCKVEITMYDNKEELISKALLSAKVLRK
jgi:predicted transcriptional regulator